MREAAAVLGVLLGTASCSESICSYCDEMEMRGSGGRSPVSSGVDGNDASDSPAPRWDAAPEAAAPDAAAPDAAAPDAAAPDAAAPEAGSEASSGGAGQLDARGPVEAPDATPPRGAPEAAPPLSPPEAGRADAGLEPPCEPDFHSLPVAEFPECMEYWSARDLWPQTIAVSPDGTRMAGSFQATPLRGRVLHAMTPEDFEAERLAADESQWSVRNFNAYRTPEGEKRYSAIFEPSGTDDAVSRIVVSEELAAAWEDMFWSGYSVTDGFQFQEEGETLLFMNWVRYPEFVDVPFRHYASYSGFAADNERYVQGGYRIARFYVVPRAGSAEYGALWEKTRGNRFVWLSGSTADYVDAHARFSAAGYVLYQVNLHGMDSYAAIWAGPHDICAPGARLLSESDPCAAPVCASALECCATGWTDRCITLAVQLCSRCQ